MVKYIAFIFLVFGSVGIGRAQTSKQLISSSGADTWAAIDGLGRQVAMETHGGQIRKNKYVGIFYFIWQGAHGYDTHRSSPEEGVMAKLKSDTVSPYDITKLLKKNAENPNYGPIHSFHYWGEPYFGYYLPDDEWIIRKHAQMLSDAGIDVVILDITNASTYLGQVTKIATIYQNMRKEGKSTPSIAFIVNSQPEKTVQKIYNDIYQRGLFKDLWFNWKGKPLLLCPPEGLNKVTGDFFNNRQSWAWSKGQDWFGNGKDKWPWLDHSPQSYGWHENPDKAEEISVAIAEHPVSNIGRSFHRGKEPENKQSGKGLYFNEQWKRALEVDPEFVFVTGWNEWVAMRFDDGASDQFLGKAIKKGDTYFVDLYNEEYSRDAEPVKGSFNDNYYYQLVDNIRKFKGSRSLPVYTQSKSIKIDGKFEEWKKIQAVFKDDVGDTLHRNHPGWGRIENYSNSTGRNDIIESKVVTDAEHVYFFVKTNQKLTSYKDKDWMNLYLGLPNQFSDGFQGFQFLVNSNPSSAYTTNICKYINGQWKHIDKIAYRYNENMLELKIPKSILGIDKSKYIIDFKWTDNSPVDDNCMNWLDKGDVAPNARYRYRYIKN